MFDLRTTEAEANAEIERRKAEARARVPYVVTLPPDAMEGLLSGDIRVIDRIKDFVDAGVKDIDLAEGLS